MPRSTSLAAEREIKPHIARLQGMLLDALRKHGPMTDEQMQDVCCMQGSTQRPRRLELQASGIVVDTNEKRRTKSGRLATVWKLRDQPREQLGIPGIGSGPQWVIPEDEPERVAIMVKVMGCDS